MKLINIHPENFNKNYIYFNDPIQNTIINESRFIRIIYSTPDIVFNGINVLVKINIDNVDKQFNKNFIYYTPEKNTETINTKTNSVKSSFRFLFFVLNDCSLLVEIGNELNCINKSVERWFTILGNLDAHNPSKNPHKTYTVV